MDRTLWGSGASRAGVSKDSTVDSEPARTTDGPLPAARLARGSRSGALGKVALAVLSVTAILMVARNADSAAKRAHGSATQPQGQVEPVTELMGYSVTSGAAPGYIDDQACSVCHGDIYSSYQDVAMSHSLYRPDARPSIETLDTDFVHEASGRHYRIRNDDGRWSFRRWQVAEDGQEINVFEHDIDWIIGSGNHSRTYHFRNAAGELYQLPLAWYTQEDSWGMAPGFEGRDHPGVMRRVRRECMACHNAFPDVPAGSDVLGIPQWFPEELPQGTGCQRCHGPGADHVSKAMGGFALQEDVRAAIVNPAKLSVERRNDVCYQCHMQPSVVIPGIRRFGVGDYSFRPGQDLSEQRLFVDIVEEGLQPSERFEINHHPYRLEQSPCFTESAGALSCMTCHDPHSKIPETETIEHFRAACTSCHESDACQLEAMVANGTFENTAGISVDNCTACHMPKRRTQDVVEVVMTDHLIRRQPGGPELVAPLPARDPVVLEITPLRSSESGSGHPTNFELASGVIRLAGSDSAVDQLEGLLGEKKAEAALDPLLDLLRGQLFVRRHKDAEATARLILERKPDNAQALEWLGLALIGQGRFEEAVEVVSRAERIEANRPETSFNLGLAYFALQRWDEAADALKRSLTLRRNNPRAWFYLGGVEEQRGNLAAAKTAYRQVLSVEPKFDRAYLRLARILRDQGDPVAADRILAHGVRWGDDPRALEAELAQGSPEASESGT